MNYSRMTQTIVRISNIIDISVYRYRKPKWNILAFPTNITLSNQPDRSEALDTIVRDIILLSECDYIICGFSSNVSFNQAVAHKNGFLTEYIVYIKS